MHQPRVHRCFLMEILQPKQAGDAASCMAACSWHCFMGMRIQKLAT